jgi:hypothetical protein
MVVVIVMMVATAAAQAQEVPAATQSAELAPGLEVLAFLVSGAAVLAAAIMLIAQSRGEDKK